MKNRAKFLIIIIVSMLFLGALNSFISEDAFASEAYEKYTSVISDLQKDESFEIESYPIIENDNSLNLIQIAESNDRELFLYVYQAGISVKASSINISLNLHDELSFKNYNLQFLNSAGVFQKYLVEDLFVLPEAIRFYEISSIFRNWDEDLDGVIEGNNTISEVSYEVAKIFTFTSNETGYQSTVVDVEIIEITDKYVGLVRYPQRSGSGTIYPWTTPGYDSHFIAFSTNKPIEKLYEADVFYTSQSFDYLRETAFGITIKEKPSYGEVIENQTNLKYEDFETVDAGMRRYSFDRIQTTTEFVETEDREWIHKGIFFNRVESSQITEEGMQNINDKQWVLRFAETINLKTGGVSNYGTRQYKENYTIVGDVTILRMKFETDGVVYNLGVIDNKKTGSGNPDNEFKEVITLSKFSKIVIGVLALLLLPALLIILKSFFEIILLPFSIFKKRE